MKTFIDKCFNVILNPVANVNIEHSVYFDHRASIPQITNRGRSNWLNFNFVKHLHLQGTSCMNAQQ